MENFEQRDDKPITIYRQFHRYFTLRSTLDLNSFPDIQTPTFLLKDNSGGLGSFFRKNKHPVRFTLKLSKRGFVLSEGLRFNIRINNGSNNKLHSALLELIQVLGLGMLLKLNIQNLKDLIEFAFLGSFLFWAMNRVTVLFFKSCELLPCMNEEIV
jgi:hypothetical protein